MELDCASRERTGCPRTPALLVLAMPACLLIAGEERSGEGAVLGLLMVDLGGELEAALLLGAAAGPLLLATAPGGRRALLALGGATALAEAVVRPAESGRGLC